LCLVHQPFGLGDLMFVQKIVAHYLELGHEIIHPVRDDLCEAARALTRPGVRFVAWEGDDYPHKAAFLETVAWQDANLRDRRLDRPIEHPDFLFLPLGNAHRRGIRRRMMSAKYLVARVDPTGWAACVPLTRDRDREAHLFGTVLGLNADEPYALFNASSSDARVAFNLAAVPPGVKALRRVDLRPIPGFTLFDWATVIERAQVIATIDTALVLLVEVLAPRAAELHLASRYWPPTYRNISDILRLQWQFLDPESDDQ